MTSPFGEFGMIRSYSNALRFGRWATRLEKYKSTILKLEELELRMAPAVSGAAFHDVVTGDFNGDGRQDVAGRTDNGQWWVSLSTGSGFSNYLWTTWNEAAGWQHVIAGDFTGDGKTDIAGMTSSGQWWVAASTGSSFVNSLWTIWSPNVTWVDVKAGNFSPGKMAGITGRILQNGQWWTALSTGSSFNTTLWATWNPNATWVDVQAADFSGDGLTDIAGRFLQGGQWFTGVSTGSSFVTSLWTTWSPNVNWVDVKSGDFDKDGKADLTGRDLASGNWWTALSNGSSFTNSLWATWSPNVTWVDVQVGDFNGDGRADITGRDLASGNWWTGLSTGASFTTTLWDRWSPAITWDSVNSADVTGDGKSDLVGRVDSGGQWWAAVSNGSAFANQFWTTWAFVSSSDQNFISQEYLDLLKRPVTPTELSNWINFLNQGFSHFQQAQDLEAVAEYRSDEVGFAFHHFLGRAPSPTELSNNVAFLLNGGLFETLEANIVGSAEYFAISGGTINGFLNKAYQDLLSRSPDATGLASWTMVLQAGTSRTEFASLIISGPEYATLHVDQDILNYLRRPATAADQSALVGVLQQNGEDLVIAMIIGSAEYNAFAQSNPQTPIPTIASVSPTRAAVGSTVTFTGSFLTGAAVAFNGISAPPTVSPDGTMVTVTVPVGATDGPLTLTTPFSSTFGSFSTSFVVLPRITGFSPSSGAILSQVMISGNNFTGATGVSFGATADPGGGLPNGGFVVNSDTQITATVPNGASISSLAISVTTPDGTAVSPTNFTVTAPGSPTISSINPNNVTAAGGVGGSVVITGTNFIVNQTTAVFVKSGGGTVSATVQSINNTGTSMTVLVPSGAVTGPITVANNSGSMQSAVFFFLPTIGSATPNPAVFGQTITITGTNFLSTTVTVDGVTPAGLSFNPDGIHLSFTASNVAGTHTLQITNAAGTITRNFTINEPNPSITSVVTDTGFMNWDDATLMIKGSFLESTNAVTFTMNGTPFAAIAPTTVVNSGEVDVSLPSLISAVGGASNVISVMNTTNSASVNLMVTVAGANGSSNSFAFTLSEDDGLPEVNDGDPNL
jgi:hypothetical protein